MKPTRILATVLVIGLVALGMGLLTFAPGLTEETDEARAAQADRLGLTGQDRSLMIGENEVQEETEALLGLSDFYYDRYLYPAYQFDNAWMQNAREQDEAVQEKMPAGLHPASIDGAATNLSGTGFTSLGPNPLQMNGCSSCYQYGLVQGRVNVVVVDPVSPTIAYFGSDGGGVWKTTNCCSAATSWTVTTDQDNLQGIAIGDITIDPNNHAVVYAGTGDLRYGSFSFGSSGLLKSTDYGETWELLGEDVFGPFYTNPGTYPQYNAIGKVQVNPNNSQQVAVGTKFGVHFSYDGGTNWTAACIVNPTNNQRQDITAMHTRDQGTTTDLIVGVGTRGTETEVQQNLNQNGANGIYRVEWPSSGCPGSWTLISTPANGWPAGTGTGINNEQAGGNILGRIDMAVAPSNPDIMYAQVQGVLAPNLHNLLGLWRTNDYGASWTQVAASAALRNCAGTGAASQGQNWYDQGVAIDPNNPDIVWIQGIDTFRSVDGGVTFGNVSCGYEAAGGDIHVDMHGIIYVPGSSNQLLMGNDGGIYYSANANIANKDQITFSSLAANVDTSALEFYSGDITANFATDGDPGISGGMQDNGSAYYRWNVAGGEVVGPATWQMRNGGDGMYSAIEPTNQNTTTVRIYQESQNGSLRRYDGWQDTTSSSATAPSTWGGDRLNFVFPYAMNKWGDCTDTDADGHGCENMIGGTFRVWETIQGAVPTSSWLVNSPDLTKGNIPPPGGLGARAYINQLTYAFDDDSIAMVGTNDGNVQFGFNMGQGVANSATWVNVTGGNSVLPNRPILDVITSRALPPFDFGDGLVGYAALGGFSENTPGQPGGVYEVTCTALCATFTWVNKSGNLPNIPVDSIIINPRYPQQAFAGTDWGLYYTDDITVAVPTWYRFPGLPHVMIWDMTVDQGYTTLALFTRSRGAYVWPLPDAPIGGPTPTATATATNTATATATNTATNTPVPPTATATATIPAGAQVVTYCSTFSPLTIPDNLPAAGITGTLTIPAAATILDANVRISTTHTWVGDLTYRLTNGTTSTIIVDRPGFPVLGAGCNSNNIDDSFVDDEGTDGTWESSCSNVTTQTPAYPAGSRLIGGAPVAGNPTLMTAYDGASTAGTWSLYVTDSAAQDSGTFNQFCMEFLVPAGATATATPTNTAVPPTSTATATPTNTAVPPTSTPSVTVTPTGSLPPSTSTPTVTATPGSSGRVCSSTVVTIPDSNPTGATSVINVGTAGTISDLNVVLTGTHSWVGDLVFNLSNGTTNVTFYDQPGVPASTFGCSGDNLPGVVGDDEGSSGSFENSCQNSTPAYTPGGSYTGNSPLSAFDGATAAGNWTLTVSDLAAGDTGTLDGWCVDITTGAGPTATPTVSPTPQGQVPDINLNPSSFVETHSNAPQVTTDTLNVQNVGSGTLTWTIVEDDSATTPVEDITDKVTIAPRDARLNTAVGGVMATRFLSSGAMAPSLFGGINLTVDDGVAEDSIGLTAGGQFVWFNRFTPAAGDFPFTLDEIQLQTTSVTNCAPTDLVDFYVYTDADGNPANGATFVGSLLNQQLGTLDQFNSFPVNFNLTGPGDVLIAVVNRGCTAAGAFPATIDTTASQVRSWIGLYAGSPANPPVFPAPTFGTIDSLGFAGNWLIRGVGSQGGGACSAPTDIPWLTVSPTNGSTAGGGSSPVTLTYNSAALANGTYTGTLCVASNDPDEALVTVPVTLIVEEPTAIDIGSFTSPVAGVNLGDLAAAGLLLLAGAVLVLRRK
jgi:subtilisin-like proprotein convertase family protein